MSQAEATKHLLIALLCGDPSLDYKIDELEQCSRRINIFFNASRSRLTALLPVTRTMFNAIYTLGSKPFFERGDVRW